MNLVESSVKLPYPLDGGVDVLSFVFCGELVSFQSRERSENASMFSGNRDEVLVYGGMMFSLSSSSPNFVQIDNLLEVGSIFLCDKKQKAQDEQ